MIIITFIILGLIGPALFLFWQSKKMPKPDYDDEIFPLWPIQYQVKDDGKAIYILKSDGEIWLLYSNYNENLNADDSIDLNQFLVANKFPLTTFNNSSLVLIG